MVNLLVFISGVFFTIGGMMYLAGVKIKKINPRESFVYFMISMLMAPSLVLLFQAGEMKGKMSVSTDTTETGQVETVGKPTINGYPINFTDLPDGTYDRIEDEGFAFIQSENENPFEREGIIAVYSREKIPLRFSMKKGKITSVTIKNPLLEKTPNKQ